MAHEHVVKDTGPHFLIDPMSRKITYDSKQKLVLMQYDHNSEEATFDMPRYIDGHDTMLCNCVRAHYINIGSSGERNPDIYPILGMKVKEDDEDFVTFTWLFSGGCTKYAGTLNFVIRFQCIENGEITYDWGTDVYKSIIIRSSLNNTETVVEEYTDVLMQWKTETDSKIDVLGGKIDNVDAKIDVLNTNVEEVIDNLPRAKIGWATLLADKWEGEASPFSQIVEIEGVTENSQVDLTPSVEQLNIFYDKDLTFVTENIDGVVTVYAIGQKPSNDYTIQVTITEVDA